MADTTPNYGFVIPSDGGTDLMDADLWRTPVGQIDTVVKGIDNRLKVIDTDAPVVSTTVLNTPAANFQIVEQFFYKLGKFVFGNFRIKRVTTQLASSADGNITNITVCGVSAGWRPPNEAACPPTGTYGMPIPGVYITNGGTMGIGALLPNIPWGVNDECQFSTFYIQSA